MVHNNYYSTHISLKRITSSVAGTSRLDQFSHGKNGDSHFRSIFVFASCAFGLTG